MCDRGDTFDILAAKARRRCYLHSLYMTVSRELEDLYGTNLTRPRGPQNEVERIVHPLCCEIGNKVDKLAHEIWWVDDCFWTGLHAERSYEFCKVIMLHRRPR